MSAIVYAKNYGCQRCDISSLCFLPFIIVFSEPTNIKWHHCSITITFHNNLYYWRSAFCALIAVHPFLYTVYFYCTIFSHHVNVDTTV